VHHVKVGSLADFHDEFMTLLHNWSLPAPNRAETVFALHLAKESQGPDVINALCTLYGARHSVI
jgi:hypothetical protein